MIAKLPEHLREQLDAIEPSVCLDLWYRPCMARLKDGTVLPWVYVVPDPPYLAHWGIYPWADPGKRGVAVDQVASLSESSSRLPARFANKLYEAGESGMGYIIFTILFRDGSRQACLAGGAVDFVCYPEGLTADDVADVIPHEGRNAKMVNSPDYYWCLFRP